MRYINSFFFIVLLVFGSFLESNSQGFSNHNWYFGSSGSGLVFSKNTGTPVISPITALNLGGTATASDPLTGTVLFYTNGSRVYESTHGLMLNGTGLNGNTNGNQPVAICNLPGSPDRYYIFTNDADFNSGGNIEYTVVNMASAGNSIFPAPAVGAVDNSNKNVATGITNSSEGMVIVPNGAQDGFWLITHENSNNNYVVVPISSTGTVGAPVVTNIGAITLVSHIAYNQASGRIAVAPQNQNEDVEILDFDPASGALTNATTIAGTGNADFASEAVFDVEWSVTGDMLYFSRHGGAGTVANLMQYDVANATGPVNVLGAAVERSYGLQLAPDNNLYHLYQQTTAGPYLLGRVIEPDSLTTNPAFGYATALLNSANAQAEQFPAFLPPYDPGLILSFTPNSACLNNGVTFTPFLVNTATSDTVNIDQAFWDFGDGIGASNSIIPIYTYTDNSNLNPNVNLLVTSGGQGYAASGALTLTDFQLQVTMVQDTIFCTNEFPPPVGIDGTASVVAQISGTTTSIAWFGPGGQLPNTSATLQPDSAGYYYIVATDGSGCTAYAGVNVQEYGVAEQRANIWYFGQNAGIDFNSGAAVAIGDSQMNTFEGCAAISDRNGQIVFYTDGVNVYDRTHTQIVTNIGGEQDATQSAIVVPFINDETKYYIFTTQELYGSYTYQLKYSVFDLKENGGNGAIIEEDNLIFSPSTERVTASPNWLIAHEYGNNTFRAYPLTTAGIGQPVFSNIGSSHFFSDDEYGQGYMELGVNDRLITAVSNGSNENYLEIFDFDPSTGILSNYRQIDLAADGATGQVYGIEASSGGNKLFASVRNGANSQMIEYYFDSNDDPVFVQLVNNLPDIGAIQTGPDGQVYVAMNNLGTLGTITPNEDTLQMSIIDPTISTFSLAGGTQSTLGLPNFIQNLSSPAMQPTMTVMNGCGGDPLNFTATGTSTIDQFQWNIVMNNTIVASSTNQNPTFTNLTTPGTYTANLFIYNRCPNSPDATLTMDFEIYPPATVTTQLVQNVQSSCGGADGAFDIDVTSSVPFSYSVLGPVNSAGINLNGPLTINVTNLSAGSYTVVVTELVNGCSTTLTQAISDPVPYSSTVTPGNALCDGTGGTLEVNIAGTPGANSITYTISNQTTGAVVSGPTTEDISTTNPFTITGLDIGTYSLQLQDGSVPACSEFTANIVVTTPPIATLTMPTQASACGTNSVDVEITTDAGSLSINPATGVSFAGTTLTFALPGNYTVTALGDNIALCDNSQDITIIFNDVTPSPFVGQYIICPEDPLPDASQVTLSAGSSFITVNWFDDNNNPLTSGSAYDITGDSITIFEPGIVVAELTNAFGCVTVDTINIVEDCQPRIVAPNAFRPNSSDIDNQSFSVYSLFVVQDEFEIFIFSRWGEIVYESNDVNFAWNGSMNNRLDQQLPVGTYAYVIRFVSEYEPEKGVQEQRGGVLLIR